MFQCGALSAPQQNVNPRATLPRNNHMLVRQALRQHRLGRRRQLLPLGEQSAPRRRRRRQCPLALPAPSCRSTGVAIGRTNSASRRNGAFTLRLLLGVDRYEQVSSAPHRRPLPSRFRPVVRRRLCSSALRGARIRLRAVVQVRLFCRMRLGSAARAQAPIGDAALLQGGNVHRLSTVRLPRTAKRCGRTCGVLACRALESVADGARRSLRHQWKSSGCPLRICGGCCSVRAHGIGADCCCRLRCGHSVVDRTRRRRL